MYLRRKLGAEAESVFCYVNNIFAPGLDEGVGGLWRVCSCFFLFFFSFFFFREGGGEGIWDMEKLTGRGGSVSKRTISSSWGIR